MNRVIRLLVSVLVLFGVLGLSFVAISSKSPVLEENPLLQATEGCFITPTPIPCNTPVPTSTFPPTITPFVTNTPQSTQNLIQNPWFADENCQNSKEGWTDTSEYVWGTGVPKTSNPGPCDTAIRWYYSSHPPNEWGEIEQAVNVSGFSSLNLRYWFVSLSSGYGEVNLMDESRNLIGQSTWGGHLIVWQQSEWIPFSLPIGVNTVIVQLRGTYLQSTGGVKISGVELEGIP